jgi:Undecaprenyl-phosphate glucose phosphotransferase
MASKAHRGARPQRVRLTRTTFSIMAALLDLALILWSAIAVELTYNKIVYGWNGLAQNNIQLCFVVALLFVGLNIVRRGYSIAAFLEMSGHARRVVVFWNMAFLFSIFLGFIGRASDETSRVAFVSFYFIGLAALYIGRAILVLLVRNSAQSGGVLAARVMLVGAADDLGRFRGQNFLNDSGKDAVACCALGRDEASHGADLNRAVRLARRLRPDEIMIVAPLGQAALIDRCIAAFLSVPAAITVHVLPGDELNRFAGAMTSGLSSGAALRLPGHAMSSADMLVKRGFDIAVSSLALLLLSPVFMFVALAIKLDSPGPVFFFQTRHGFNKRPFRIAKFRSMTTAENGRAVKQATSGDMRVTRTGRFIRKYNLDELPQLLNVLRGEMSLVGPRPHAVVHDRSFERAVALYSRRHNVKPGITGWAQVNGLRGPTDTPEKIGRRVQHDLYYVDHWSLLLDLWILLLTLFSRKAYQNAF